MGGAAARPASVRRAGRLERDAGYSTDLLDRRLAGERAFRGELHADLGRAMAAVEQAQRRHLQPQVVQQLAQRPPLLEEASQEGQAELIGEGVDRLMLGGDRPGEAEGVEHVQERPGLAGLGRLAGVEEGEHPLGPLAVVERAQQVAQVARRDPLRAELEVFRVGVAHPVEEPGISLFQRDFELLQGARHRQAGLGQEVVQLPALLVLEVAIDFRVHDDDDPRLGPRRHPLQGLNPSTAGQVVSDRPERSPALDPLARLERWLVLGRPLVVDQVPWHGQEGTRVG